jgi:hypothetical protein
VGKLLPQVPMIQKQFQQVGELDELETFVGSKKTKSGYGKPLTTLKKEF